MTGHIIYLIVALILALAAFISAIVYALLMEFVTCGEGGADWKEDEDDME